jgi:hypothetical protein
VMHEETNGQMHCQSQVRFQAVFLLSKTCYMFGLIYKSNARQTYFPLYFMLLSEVGFMNKPKHAACFGQ